LDATAPHPPLSDTRPLATEEDDGRILHLGTLNRAGDVGHSRAQRADAQAGATSHARRGLCHEARAQLVVRRDDGPAARIGFGEHVHEIRVGYPEQGVDTLGLEEVENAFVDRDSHVNSFYW
jgi:hypothetical protein